MDRKIFVFVGRTYTFLTVDYDRIWYLFLKYLEACWKSYEYSPSFVLIYYGVNVGVLFVVTGGMVEFV